MTDKPNSEEMNAALAQAAKYLSGAKRVAVLTGAGISAESGISTFRDQGGLWEGHSVEEVATPQGFARNPELVWKFYNARRDNLAQAQPNPGHVALAKLEKRFGQDNFAIITQNVDGLHRAAGSRTVWELHGSLKRIRCTGADCSYVEDRADKLPDMPKCDSCGELLRPDVVWFGEILPQDIWFNADQFSRSCDCFLVIGTSAVVWPAAGLIVLAKAHGAKVLEFNLTRTEASSQVDVGLYGPSGQLLPLVVARMEGG